MTSPLSTLIWETRYRAAGEQGYADTCRRVAGALAALERAEADAWRERFYALLSQRRFLPGGRILAGAGVAHEVTLFNCFVMGLVPDDMGGIFDALKEGALTMQQGGGIGVDFSLLRPSGMRCRRVGGIASGPVSYMKIWDAMCATLLSSAARRGAMMGTLRCDHPDIEAFIEAKREAAALRNFNLSVLASDAFMAAVENDDEWALVFPRSGLSAEDRERHAETLERPWSGSRQPVACAVVRRVRARELWRQIMQANYDAAEPGVLFIDRINAMNNLYNRESISATNPCGEVPLPAYGACNLGSLNLAAYVRAPFAPGATIDFGSLADDVAVAVRLLDNVIDCSRFPLPAQREQAQGTRRIGLGFTALADALMMLGQRYDSETGRQTAARFIRTICHAAYRASVDLARERGAFRFFDCDAYLDSSFVRDLPADIREGITRWGMRNSHLTAVAPTGTISLIADNLSGGIEPVFAASYRRRVRDPRGEYREYDVEDYAVALWRRQQRASELPPAFVDARQIAADDHLAMQAAVQPYVDSAVSKTVNVPTSVGLDDFSAIYQRAYRLGLKGCTTFRPNAVTGHILADSIDSVDDAPDATVLVHGP